MTEHTAQRALAASAFALVVCGGCVAAFLPPLHAQTLASLPRTLLFGAALAVALLLHWVYLGIGAHRLRRSVAGWTGLSVLLFPIGSVAALLLLGLLGHESSPAPASVPGG
jgi:hypothetical protein